jgi:tetratricopeptide (TPR) repeat protein
LFVEGPERKTSSLVMQGDLESARRDFESAIAIYPVYPDAHQSLGRLHLRQKRADLALPHLRQATEVRPHWPAAFLNLGDAQWLVGEEERVLVSFERAVSQAPRSADAHHRLAAARHEKGRLGEAAAGYREALRIDPSHASAARGLARLQREAR